MNLVRLLRYRAALRAMPPPCRALDVGGGYGEFAAILRARGYSVIVADIAGGGVTVDVALPFADNEFDVAICLAVAEHVMDWPRLLSELRRVARRVVLTTPSPAAHPLLVLMARLGLVPADHIAEHKHYITRAGLSSAGYRVRRFTFGLNQLGVAP